MLHSNKMPMFPIQECDLEVICEKDGCCWGQISLSEGNRMKSYVTGHYKINSLG